MTLNMSAQLALGRAPTCVLGWTPKGCGESNKPLVLATPEAECLSQMQAQIDQLLAEWSIPDPVQKVILETHSPYPASISTMIPPKNFKMPTILLYDGKTDSVAHVQTYKTWMNIAKADAPTLCNAFPLTL